MQVILRLGTRSVHENSGPINGRGVQARAVANTFRPIMPWKALGNSYPKELCILVFHHIVNSTASSRLWMMRDVAGKLFVIILFRLRIPQICELGYETAAR
jgi:hypothetical protein